MRIRASFLFVLILLVPLLAACGSSSSSNVSQVRDFVATVVALTVQAATPAPGAAVTPPAPPELPDTAGPTPTPLALDPLPPAGPTDTPAIPGPIFYDTFDTGLRPEWESEADNAWGSVNGQLTNLVGGHYLQVGDFDWTNYLLSVDVAKIVSRCLFRINGDINQDDHPDRRLEMGFDSNGLRWRTPDTDSELPGSGVSDLQIPYNLKLKIQEDGSVTTLINDEVVLDLVLAGYTQGKIGLNCGGGTVFDNFAIWPLN